MKHFLVLGPGCRNCDTTAKLIQERADRTNQPVCLEKVTDMATILGHGVMSTPGVVLDGKLLHAGSVPTPSQIDAWLQT
ncbi:MAG: thioredoxin family protein [Magnetococcales bacterium]|nr:thioredoxin family protein [Magnetococcales bacterium]